MQPSTSSRAVGGAALVAFVATVWGANWALEEYGIIDLPGTGLEAPAGVWFAGLAFGLRDAVHEMLGRRFVVAGILAGAVLSWIVSDAVSIPGGHASIAVASGVAFLLSEAADLAVYDPLRERNWVAAVAASNIVGAILDSALFLWLAFGSLDFISGQVIGKALMILPGWAVVFVARRSRRRHDG